MAQIPEGSILTVLSTFSERDGPSMEFCVQGLHAHHWRPEFNLQYKHRMDWAGESVLFGDLLDKEDETGERETETGMDASDPESQSFTIDTKIPRLRDLLIQVAQTVATENAECIFEVPSAVTLDNFGGEWMFMSGVETKTIYASLLKSISMRVLSGEHPGPGKEGSMFFGSHHDAHVFAYIFKLSDSCARGFQRFFALSLIARSAGDIVFSWKWIEREMKIIAEKLKHLAQTVFDEEATSTSTSSSASLSSFSGRRTTMSPPPLPVVDEHSMRRDGEMSAQPSLVSPPPSSAQRSARVAKIVSPIAMLRHSVYSSPTIAEGGQKRPERNLETLLHANIWDWLHEKLVVLSCGFLCRLHLCVAEQNRLFVPQPIQRISVPVSLAVEESSAGVRKLKAIATVQSACVSPTYGSPDVRSLRKGMFYRRQRSLSSLIKLERSPKRNETKRDSEADVNSCGSFFNIVSKLLGKKTARMILWCIVAGNQLVIRGNDPKATQALVEMLTQLVPLPCVMLVPLSDQYIPGYECNFLGLVETSQIKRIDFNSSILLDVEFDVRTEGGSFSLEDFSKRGGIGGSIEDGIDSLELEQEEEDVQHIHISQMNVYYNGPEEVPTIVQQYEALFDSKFDTIVEEMQMQVILREWVRNSKLFSHFVRLHRFDMKDGSIVMDFVQDVLHVKPKDIPIMKYFSTGSWIGQ